MGQASGGAMAAVVKLTEDRLLSIIETNELTRIDVTNYNSPSQIVISGLKTDIQKASKFVEEAGGLFIV